MEPEIPNSELGEINYIENLSKVRGISPAEVEEYHLRKPFIDHCRGWYVMDLGLRSENTRQVVQDFVVTEKDMEFKLQKTFMEDAAFSEIRQYYRLIELTLEDVSSEKGRAEQINQFANFYAWTLEAGLTSIVVAVK